MTTLQCLKCGFTRQETALDTYECCMCGNIMVITYKEEVKNSKETIEGILPDYFIEAIRHDIEILGNDRAWLAIESISPCRVRVQYRKYFFLAGGK